GGIAPAATSAPASDLEADLAEMGARLLVAKGVGDYGQGEGPVDHRLEPGGLDRAHHVELVPAAADDEPLEPLLPGHQGGGGHRPGPAGQTADQGNVAADPAGRDRLRQGTRPADLDDMVDAAPACPVEDARAPVLLRLVVEHVVGA